MTNLRALAKDVLNLVENIDQIVYKDGDNWKSSEEEPEHPMVSRLRSIVHSPVSVADDHRQLADENSRMILDERRALDKYRDYVSRLRELCVESGMLECEEPLEWLKDKIDTR